jgi:UDP-N-acetylmuramoylalanine--D-glutamate ligase
VYVLELSSFQLDGIDTFRPDIAAILNITPDHLDRYDHSLEKYADSKLRIARNQHSDDHLILLLDPKTLVPALRRNKANAEVTTVDPVRHVDSTEITVDGWQYDLSPTALAGRHNALNACFAVRIAQLLGVDDEQINAALMSFTPAAHRMEIVPTDDGRRWINDSKATNVDSTYYALESMTTPTVWIAGGTDKGNDYTALYDVIGKVHTLICLGLDNRKLVEAFTGRIEYVEENRSLESVILRAAEVAGAGWTILLSPACASFDLFKNYEDRGNQFRELVQNHFA